MSRPDRRRVSVVDAALAANQLSAGGVTQFSLTSAAPLLVCAGLIPASWAATGIVAIPAAFVVLAVILAVFCAGYLAMARRLPYSGALYTYVAAGLGRPAGTAAAMVTLIGYSLLQVGLYGAFGPTASALLLATTGVALPWWACSLIAWTVVAVLGQARVNLNSKVLALLLAAEVLLVVGLDLVFVTHPADGHLSFTALDPSQLLGPQAGVALAIAMAGFVGVEGAAAFSEEARDSGRTIPRATLAALVVMTVIYTGTSWAVSVATGPDQVIDASRQHGVDLLFTLGAQHLGTWIIQVGNAFFLTSMLAGQLAFHGLVARYAFSLGREGVLWSGLARVRLSTGAPVIASLAQSLTGLVVILTFAAQGWDPIARLFYWSGTIGAFGILIALTACSLAVPAYFWSRDTGVSAWQWLFAPTVAALGLGAVVTWTVIEFPALLGVDPAADGTDWTTVFLGMYAAAIIFGLLWSLWLRTVRRDAYDNIGRGPTVTPVGVAVTNELAGALR